MSKKSLNLRSLIPRARPGPTSNRGGRQATATIIPVTYVSAWVTRNGPSNFNNMQPHRLYAFTNSTGSTVYIYNQNIRAPLSGVMGKNPPPTNAEYQRLLGRLIRRIGGRPRYIANMTRNILAARQKATNAVFRARIRARGNSSPRTTNEKNANNAHNKQIAFWTKIQQIVNAMPNNATRRIGNVNANVRATLELRRSTIKHKV
jgi:hypothetical protein